MHQRQEARQQANNQQQARCASFSRLSELAATAPSEVVSCTFPSPRQTSTPSDKSEFGSLILAKRQMQRSNSITLSAAELHSTKGAGTRANNQTYTVKDGTNCTCFALMHFHGNVTVPIPE